MKNALLHSLMNISFLKKKKNWGRQVFQNFNFMIKKQYNENIKILCIDNGMEYFNSILNNFLKKHGLIHQSSCVHMP